MPPGAGGAGHAFAGTAGFGQYEGVRPAGGVAYGDPQLSGGLQGGSGAGGGLELSLVSRGTAVLAEWSAVGGNALVVAKKILERLPEGDTRVSYTQVRLARTPVLAGASRALGCGRAGIRLGVAACGSSAPAPFFC